LIPPETVVEVEVGFLAQETFVERNNNNNPPTTHLTMPKTLPEMMTSLRISADGQVEIVDQLLLP
jgi:hypothetical protein